MAETITESLTESLVSNCIQFHSLPCVSFGRRILYTNFDVVDESNVLNELKRVLSNHNANAQEIHYLDSYYRGNAPILYRVKKNRPEVNNKVVTNIAHYIVETHTSEVAGEPIQYVQHGVEQKKTEEINALNQMLADENKDYLDIELCRWRSICGTAFRFVRRDLESENGFSISVEEPETAFVCYNSNTKKPVFGCLIRKDVDGKPLYNVYTKTQFFAIKDGKIKEKSVNGLLMIPLIEYPNNARRLSDIELTIELTDEINTMTSDRANAVEQFVSAWIKFINCDIDIEKFRELRAEGFFKVNSNEGSENKADVEVMTSELNQTETQVAVDDLFQKVLILQGIANRESNTGGDTGSAVELRNGFASEEQKAKISEPIFKRSEREMLKAILKILKVDKAFTISASDIEIKITRNRNNNMLTKAEVLQILLNCGIEYSRAIKTVGLFSDPEQVAKESRERMEKLYSSKTEVPSNAQSADNAQTNKVTDNGTNAEN